MKRYFLKLSFVFLLFVIIQCKNSQTPNNTNSNANDTSAANSPSASSSASSSCPLSPQAVTQAMGLANLVKIDASQIKIQNPDYAILEYTSQVKSLILQITPMASDNPNIYPDYAKYRITDANNHDCASGKTRSSLIREIFLPPSCATGVLTIRAQGCASSARLKNQNVACGPYTSATYTHDVNPSSSLSMVLSDIQGLDNQINLLADWLASRANKLIASLGTTPQKLNSLQALLLSLAQVFARNPSDFAEIFSGSLYQQFIVLAQSQGLKTKGMQLADADPCSSNAAQSAPITLPDDGVSAAYSGVDIQQILQDAKANNVNTGTDMNNALTGADASSIAVGTATITNGAKTATPSASKLAPYLTAAGLIAAGLVWGGVAMYYDAKNRAIYRKFFGENTPEIIDGATGEAVKIKSTKVKWVDTVDGESKVLVYKDKILVKVGDNKYALQPLEPNNLKQRAFYEFYKSDKLTESIYKNAPEFKSQSKSTLNDISIGEIKSNLKLPSLGHSIGAVTLMAMGGLLAGYTSLNLASEDPFTNFMNDMKTAEQALDNILAQKNTLEKMKTDLVVSSLPQK